MIDNTTNILPESLNSESTSEGEITTGVISLRIIGWLATRRNSIALATLVATVAGVVCSLLIPNRYTSECRLMPPKQTQSSTSMINSIPNVGSLGEAAYSSLGLKDPNAIYIGILNSRPIADRLVSRFDLQNVFRERDMTSTRLRLKDETRIISENSGMILISVTDKDKQRASDLTNAYIEELRTLAKTIALSEASRRRMFFAQELKQAKEDLVLSEAQFASVQQQKALVRPDAQAMALLSNITGLRAQIAAKQVELQGIRSYSTERNPQLQIAEQELATLESEIARFDRGSGSENVTDMGLIGISRGGLDYLRAQRDLQYQETYFQLLLKQFEAAKLDEAKDAVVIQTVESAIPADRKSSPHRASIVLVFALLGFICAVSKLWVQESIQKNPAALYAWRELEGSVRRTRPSKGTDLSKQSVHG